MSSGGGRGPARLPSARLQLSAERSDCHTTLASPSVIQNFRLAAHLRSRNSINRARDVSSAKDTVV